MFKNVVFIAIMLTGVRTMVKYPSGSLAAFRKPVTKKEEHATVRHSYKHRKGVNFSDRGMTLEQKINESKNLVAYCLPIKKICQHDAHRHLKEERCSKHAYRIQHYLPIC